MRAYEDNNTISDCKDKMSGWLNVMIWITMALILVMDILLPVYLNLNAGSPPLEGITVLAPLLLLAGIFGLYFSRRAISDSGWHCSLSGIKLPVFIVLIVLTAAAAVPLIIAVARCWTDSGLTGLPPGDEVRRHAYLPPLSLLSVYILGTAICMLGFSLCKTLKEGTIILPSKSAGLIFTALQLVNIYVFLRLSSHVLCGSTDISAWVRDSLSSLSDPDSITYSVTAGARPVSFYMVGVSLVIIIMGFAGTAVGRMYRSFSETMDSRNDKRNPAAATGYCLWCQDYSVPLYRVYKINYSRLRPQSQKIVTNSGFEKLDRILASNNITSIGSSMIKGRYVLSDVSTPLADINEKKVEIDHWCCQRCGMTVYETLRGYSGDEPVSIKAIGSSGTAKETFCAIIFREYGSKFMRQDTVEYEYYKRIAAKLGYGAKTDEPVEDNDQNVLRYPPLAFRYERRIASFTILSSEYAAKNIREKDVLVVFIDASEAVDGSGYYVSIREGLEAVRSLRDKVRRIVIAVSKYDLIGDPMLPGRCTAMDTQKSSARINAFRSFFKSRGAEVFEDLYSECRSKSDKVEMVGHSALSRIQDVKNPQNKVKVEPRFITETLDVLVK
ncbi:MAG: hypothetical protein IJ874_05170 [Ruminococcus sp.]|nr:hypothetical protein [Ruminococcus sp.]